MNPPQLFEFDDEPEPVPARRARDLGLPDVGDRVVLCDLNGCLSTNFRKANRSDYGAWISRHELYDTDLVRWLADLTSPVIIITVRHERHRRVTLDRIAAQTGWEPTGACFNSTGLNGKHGGPIKRKLWRSKIVPVYGPDPAGYLAVESNVATRATYDSIGIEAVPPPRRG